MQVQKPIVIKNVSKGPVAFGGNACPRLQIDVGQTYEWQTSRSYMPYDQQIKALLNAGLLQIGDEEVKKDETPAALDKELAHKEAEAATKAMTAAKEEIMAKESEIAAEMDAAMKSAEEVELKDSKSKSKGKSK